VFLGVDGGGSKTEFCLIDAQGTVAATLTMAGCSYLAVGFGGVASILERGVREVCAKAGVAIGAIDYAFFGLPSYGESTRDRPQLDAAPSSVLSRAHYQCDNDMVCGWAGSLGAADGINAIAGTGSMAYGEHAGRKVRCGGWGELFGDEGSAYWIAIQGLSCFSKMSDGRRAKGGLHERLRARLGLARDLDLVDLVLSQWRGERAKIASLSHVVMDAAVAGDGDALDIIERAAAELARLVDATRQQLDFAEAEAVPVSYSGGMFDSGPVFLDAFQRGVAGLRGEYLLRQPLFSPALGAALYAAKLHGTPVDAHAIPRRGGAAAIDHQSVA
jgi:N-acetylglucosamine kinase-like BadF-type ATPase